MKRVAFAGTFDPITNGHLWVIQEGLNIADEVYVMIAYNPNKKTLFSESERKSMIDQVLKKNGISDRVKTILIKNEYVAQSAIEYDCNYLIRGIRSALDFDYESLIQKTNTDVLQGAKTLFVMPPRELESVSSSFVKTLVGPVGWHWNIKEFLPQAVYFAWIKKYVTQMVFEYLTDKVWTDENKKSLLKEIFKNYKGRAYHSLEHIVHCLQELQWLISYCALNAKKIEQIVLALLCHDIILYSEDKSISDEEQSARWFENFAKEVKYIDSKAKIVANMIRKTAYLSTKELPETEEEKIMCSIDLAILAQPLKTYNWYTHAVREEYKNVIEQDFINGRIKALEHLMSQKLYTSEYFEHYEFRAKKNMENEIKILKEKMVS